MKTLRGIVPLPYRKHPFALGEHQRRLTWLYGEQRARLIMLGRDPDSNADLASWNRLGSGRECAA